MSAHFGLYNGIKLTYFGLHSVDIWLILSVEVPEGHLSHICSPFPLKRETEKKKKKEVKQHKLTKFSGGRDVHQIPCNVKKNIYIGVIW